MKVSEVSKRYAKALLAVAKQKGLHTQIYNELQAVVKIVESDQDIKGYFANPMISPDQKIAVIKNSFEGKGVSEETLRTLFLLGEKNRLGFLGEVLFALREFLDLEEGITRGVVRSAQALNGDAQKEIEQKINQVLKKKIVLTYEVDPKLLGGVVAQVGGWTFDDSLDTHLKKLNEELNRRAN